MRRVAFAFVLTTVAAGCLWMYAQSLRAELAGGTPISVLAAAREIAAGGRITKADLAVIKVPEAYVHPGAIRHGEEPQVIGRPLTGRIVAGQALQWSDFDTRPGGSAATLAAAVPKGQRAWTIPVDASASHSGLLSPGDRVDVLGNFSRAQNEHTTVTLLQNVVVLATGEQRAGANDPERRGFTTLTLSVDLEEAELLHFAAGRGVLGIALRARDDLELVSDPPEKSFRDVLEAQTRAALVQRLARKRLRALGP
jgi:pilus assembly protein CpaB